MLKRLASCTFRTQKKNSTLRSIRFWENKSSVLFMDHLSGLRVPCCGEGWFHQSMATLTAMKGHWGCGSVPPGFLALKNNSVKVGKGWKRAQNISIISQCVVCRCLFFSCISRMNIKLWLLFNFGVFILGWPLVSFFLGSSPS